MSRIAKCFAIPLEGAAATVAAPIGRIGLPERRETAFYFSQIEPKS